MHKKVFTFKPYLDLSGIKKSEIKQPVDQNTVLTPKDFEKSINKAVPAFNNDKHVKEVSDEPSNKRSN